MGSVSSELYALVFFSQQIICIRDIYSSENPLKTTTPG